MKLLVTGGAGFIGSNFIMHLLRARPEYSVVNLDKLTYAGNLENLKTVQSMPGYMFVRGDIADRRLINDIDFDAIVNFAAESHVDRSILDPSPFLHTNVIGTQNLLEIARARKCRILHVSTDEVYGSIDKGLFTEQSPLLPNSPYAASKASSDLLVRAYHKTYGIDAVVTRCTNNYGPYQFPEKLVPLVIWHALEGKQIPVYGDGRNVRDWIHVADHCAAIEMALERADAGDILNIGGRGEQQNIDIITMTLDLIAEKAGKKRESLHDLISFVADRPGHDRRYAIDPSRIEAQLGWKPVTPLQDGLRQTVDWYIENRSWWEHIISGAYLNYYRAQYGSRIQE